MPTIPDLPGSAAPLAGAEIVPVVQGGQTRRATVANIADIAIVTLGEPEGAASVGMPQGGTVASNLRFVGSADYKMKIGYDSVADQAATIAVGANDAGLGRGALQIGGAGKKDGGNGMFLSNDFHPAFSIFQNSMLYGPTELNYYGNGTGGVATSDGAGTLTITQGSVTNALVGRTIYFGGAPYTVQAVSGATVTLTTAAPAGTRAWNFSLVTGSGSCTVTGTTVTRVSGEPFIKYGSGYVFKLNGATYTVNSATPDTITLATAPGNGSYAYSYETQIYTNGGPLISGSRWQKVAGAVEEGVGIFVGPDGYRLQSFAANGGENYPLWLLSNGQEVAEFHATGKYVAFGGKAGSDGLRVYWAANVVNRVEVTGAAAGGNVAFAARGTDTNVSLNLDLQGSGAFIVSSGSYANTEFYVGTGKMAGRLSNLPNYSNDTAAAAGGVAVGQFYRNGSVMMVRAA